MTRLNVRPVASSSPWTVEEALVTARVETEGGPLAAPPEVVVVAPNT